MLIREKIFSQLKGVFQKHGGMELDTPVFELKEILSGKVRHISVFTPPPTCENPAIHFGASTQQQDARC